MGGERVVVETMRGEGGREGREVNWDAQGVEWEGRVVNVDVG